MSRSNPTSNQRNPAEKHFEWKSKLKTVQYYDKDKKQNIQLRLPFRFVYLEHMNTVSGFHKVHGGIYANEVKDTKTQRMVVKFFNGNRKIAEGFWQDIKDTVTANKGGFAINVYIAFAGPDKKLHLGTLRCHGASLGPWIEFQKKYGKQIETEAFAVKISGSTPKVNGDVEFNEPVFELEPMSQESADDAKLIDIELQKYLKDYMSRTPSAVTQPQHPAEDPQPDPVSDDPDPADVAQDDVPF